MGNRFTCSRSSTGSNPDLIKSLPNTKKSSNSSDKIILAVLQTLFPPVTPLVCKFLSKLLISAPKVSILKNNEPQTQHNAKSPLEEQVVQDIQFSTSEVCIVPVDTILQEMKDMPTFAWPEKENALEWMCSNSHHDNSNNAQKTSNGKMTVIDFSNVHLTLSLGKNIKFELPLRKSMKLEVGCGGNKVGDNAYFQCLVPTLRVWVVRKQAVEENENASDDDPSVTERLRLIGRKEIIKIEDASGVDSNIEKPEDDSNVVESEDDIIVYIAFFGEPKFIPYLHYNLDQGNGDFWSGTLEASGTVQGAVDGILAQFGPTEYKLTKRAKAKLRKKQTEKEDGNYWHGLFKSALGYLTFGDEVSRGLTDLLISMGLIGKGNNRPLRIPVTGLITNLVKDLTGDIRSVEFLERVLKRLGEELSKSKDLEQNPNQMNQDFNFSMNF